MIDSTASFGDGARPVMTLALITDDPIPDGCATGLKPDAQRDITAFRSLKHAAFAAHTAPHVSLRAPLTSGRFVPFLKWPDHTDEARPSRLIEELDSSRLKLRAVFGPTAGLFETVFARFGAWASKARTLIHRGQGFDSRSGSRQRARPETLLLTTQSHCGGAAPEQVLLSCTHLGTTQTTRGSLATLEQISWREE